MLAPSLDQYGCNGIRQSDAHNSALFACPREDYEHMNALLVLSNDFVEVRRFLKLLRCGHSMAITRREL